MPGLIEQADTLLNHCVQLAHATGEQTLFNTLLRAALSVSGCELAQVYWLDGDRHGLHLAGECLDETCTPGGERRRAMDWRDNALLQFVLRQGQPINLAGLETALHDTCFLPHASRPWQSLLCVPLVNVAQGVTGLLLCATARHRDLQAWAGPLKQLGALMQTRLETLQHERPATPGLAAPQTLATAQGYGLIGNSPAIEQVRHLIGRVLHSPCTVLLEGETGTGKEVVARAIHDHGARRARPFVVQNCAAFPESLLESELFGYRKGAFTGAAKDRAGLFDAAHGGTLLLDEIGDMPLALQAKLLRVLQEGEIRPLGANSTHRIDVRIIAATHRDLRKRISTGRFREDLYYRLAQFPLHLPALRHRDGDIARLARHFATQACAGLQRPPPQWSAAALHYLDSLDLPGNVRELKALVERAVLLCDEPPLQIEHFTRHGGVPPASVPTVLRERMEQVERALLIESLNNNGGNRTRAARELGVARRTLLYRLQRLNIQADQGYG
ncbi:sigma 54-interacting transcriptional regulator [Pseudomonas syringae]|nr:sigma 54-interacting transcriptional regulator [Pseudomonas syringae]MBD8792832.1 sigma 54-interacting transcriptional regulator [Pseudomonas syringae]MBD8803335.1 sigma 54-interacting transcriptional regulator [Pseudomonas syringae]MBD8811932.1 sigma 54-interacting transcriptional regulator [Pseudomonas syringae]